MPRPLVLDTSALLAGRPLGPGETTLIPEAILQELTPGGRDRRHLDHLLAAGATIAHPSPESRRRIREEAQRGGDLARLSAVDIDVLATALTHDAELLTDDYTVQNVARRLDMPTRGIAQPGIQQTYRFRTVCTGCRRPLDGTPQECPVCGSPTRVVRDRTA